MEKTGELNILENLERKMGALGGSACLMSLNLMSLSLTIDVCRATRYFELHSGLQRHTLEERTDPSMYLIQLQPLRRLLVSIAAPRLFL